MPTCRRCDMIIGYGRKECDLCATETRIETREKVICYAILAILILGFIWIELVKYAR